MWIHLPRIGLSQLVHLLAIRRPSHRGRFLPLLITGLPKEVAHHNIIVWVMRLAVFAPPIIFMLPRYRRVWEHLPADCLKTEGHEGFHRARAEVGLPECFPSDVPGQAFQIRRPTDRSRPSPLFTESLALPHMEAWRMLEVLPVTSAASEEWCRPQSRSNHINQPLSGHVLNRAVEQLPYSVALRAERARGLLHSCLLFQSSAAAQAEASFLPTHQLLLLLVRLPRLAAH